MYIPRQRSDPSVQDKEGNTALHVCVREGYAHGAWLLVEYLGITCLQVPNRLGLTALDVCRQYSSSKKPGWDVTSTFDILFKVIVLIIL